MFVFAIYDFNKKQLLLGRDRMGKKPLYYSIVDGTIMFASELKAMLKHPLTKKELNTSALNEYLTFDYVPTPHTIFKGIEKLAPSSYMVFEDRKIKEYKPYWKPSFSESQYQPEDAVSQH